MYLTRQINDGNEFNKPEIKRHTSDSILWKRNEKIIPGTNKNKANTSSRNRRKSFGITSKCSIILKLAKTKSLQHAINIAESLDNCKSFSRNAKLDGCCIFYRNLKLICREDLFVYKKLVGWVLINQKKAMGIALIDKDNTDLLFDDNRNATHQFSVNRTVEINKGEIDFIAAVTIDDILDYKPKKKITNKLLLKIFNKNLNQEHITKNLIWSYYRLNSHEKMITYLRNNKDLYENYLFICAGYYSKDVSDIQIGITGSIEKQDRTVNQLEKNGKYRRAFLNAAIREIKEETGLNTNSSELVHHIDSEVFFFKKDKSIFKNYLEKLLLKSSSELDHIPGIV